MTLTQISEHYYFIAALILFIIGFHTMLTHSNMIKKIIGMNIMDTSIFLFFVSIGYVYGGKAPIINLSEGTVYVNPLPSALILTGIVVTVSITAYALSLAIKLYQAYGTLDTDEIARIRSETE